MVQRVLGDVARSRLPFRVEVSGFQGLQAISYSFAGLGGSLVFKLLIFSPRGHVIANKNKTSSTKGINLKHTRSSSVLLADGLAG